LYSDLGRIETGTRYVKYAPWRESLARGRTNVITLSIIALYFCTKVEDIHFKKKKQKKNRWVVDLMWKCIIATALGRL